MLSSDNARLYVITSPYARNMIGQTRALSFGPSRHSMPVDRRVFQCSISIAQRWAMLASELTGTQSTTLDIRAISLTLLRRSMQALSAELYQL